MAGQGNLFKFVNNLVPFRTILNNNRGGLANHQQHATIKQATKDKLEELNIPDKPKKPLTPYFRFMQDHRSEVVRKNPNIKIIEVAKQCAADWAKVHPTIKEKYVKDYKSDMDIYAKISAEYVAKLTFEQREALQTAKKEVIQGKKKRELKKRIKEADKPKRPLGPYMQYLLEQAKLQNKKMSEIILLQKGKWQNLSESEKQKYIARFEVDKIRYEKEMSAWEARMIKEGNSDMVRGTTLAANKPSRLRKPKDGATE